MQLRHIGVLASVFQHRKALEAGRSSCLPGNTRSKTKHPRLFASRGQSLCLCQPQRAWILFQLHPRPIHPGMVRHRLPVKGSFEFADGETPPRHRHPNLGGKDALAFIAAPLISTFSACSRVSAALWALAGCAMRPAQFDQA